MALRKINTFDKKKGREVLAGFYDPIACIFYKKVSPKHYMVKERGYGIQEEVIQVLKKLECEEIQIRTKRDLYSFTFDVILNKQAIDYGHGLQRFLKVR